MAYTTLNEKSEYSTGTHMDQCEIQGGTDEWVWTPTLNGEYTQKETYEKIRSTCSMAPAGMVQQSNIKALFHRVASIKSGDKDTVKAEGMRGH